MTTRSKGAGKALRLSLPGAPETWHHLGGMDGIFHPVHLTPIESIGLDDQTAKALSDNESVPLELVDVGEDEIKAANKELAKASHGAIGGAHSALRDATDAVERARIIAGGNAAKAVKIPNDDKEN